VPSVVSLTRSATLASVAQYAYSATAPAGSRYIFLAGVCPLADDGATAAVGDFAGQAEVVVENMLTALADAGATITDVIFARLSVATTHQDDLIAAWDVVRAAFGSHDVPSTLVGVTVLGYDDQLVELEVVAAVVD
jgi:enamine deaminase RidA (YjgF/YER057c/UK114 family)